MTRFEFLPTSKTEIVCFPVVPQLSNTLKIWVRNCGTGFTFLELCPGSIVESVEFALMSVQSSLLNLSN